MSKSKVSIKKVGDTWRVRFPGGGGERGGFRTKKDAISYARSEGAWIGRARTKLLGGDRLKGGAGRFLAAQAVKRSKSNAAPQKKKSSNPAKLPVLKKSTGWLKASAVKLVRKNGTTQVLIRK